MPRNIKENPASAEAFRRMVRKNDLHTVLILTEKKEYEKYAGADLEQFYLSIGLEVCIIR